MIIYTNQANIILRQKGTNAMLFHFFEHDITLCIRPEDIRESYIEFRPQTTSLERWWDEIHSDINIGEYELICGELRGGTNDE